MKPKTTLTPHQMENFSIDLVDQFEGCEQANAFLKKMYGNEVDDLRKRKKDFISLINMSKSIWVINFLLNTITKPYRAKFIAGILSENLYLIEEDVVKLKIADTMSSVQTYTRKPTKKLRLKILDDYKYLSDKREDVKRLISAIGAQAIQINQSQFEYLMVQSQFLKGVILFIEEIDGNFTRSAVKFCQCLGEATQWKFMRESSTNYNKKILKSCSLSLIDYVGFFEDKD